jgi:hypothetical protein
VLGSNLSWDTGYLDLRFSVAFLARRVNAKVIPQLGYDGELGQLSQYSNWLQAGQPRSQSSSPGRVKNFLFTSSRPVLGPTQPPIQWVLGGLSLAVKQPEGACS